MPSRVVVAMSGGVDSSVAACLLVQKRYDVIGMMMRLWSEPGGEIPNRCCAPEAMAMARRVAAILGIPFYAVDAQEIFFETVVGYFIKGYTRGVTPNPCLVCNRFVRWDFLLKQALAMDAEYLATGHYARLRHPESGGIKLLRAVDIAKDQSYVLHVLEQKQLKHSLFPLGEYTKTDVRALARHFNLPVAERADSQDLCFLGENDYRIFLHQYAPESSKPGPILNRDGKLLGQHRGLAFYTIGQRKGLGITLSYPLYVLEKDISNNVLVVGTSAELGENELVANQVNWISGKPPQNHFRAQVKIRYKATESWGTITPLSSDSFHILFDEPIRDITPGQSAVVYDGEICLGGGIIAY